MKYTHLFPIACALALPAIPAFAIFPSNPNAKIFSPYLEIDSGANLQGNLPSLKTNSKTPYFTFAFLNENNANNNVIWGVGGSVAATGSSPAYLTQINALRAQGGDAIFSFGGAGSKEPADTAGMTLSTLEAQYQAVITAYHATWLDFDIEGSPLNNITANNMRNQALKDLQVANPGLQVSFTLAADPNGLDTNGFKLLQNAASVGLNVRTVNAMTMDFGFPWKVNGVTQTESQLTISTATAVHNEIKSTLPNTGIGMTVLIGQSDNAGEVFQMSDAAPVLAFAKNTSYINYLSMWSIDRDNGTSVKTTDDATDSGIIQPKWFFSNTFAAVNTPEPTSLTLLIPAALLLRRRREPVA